MTTRSGTGERAEVVTIEQIRKQARPVAEKLWAEYRKAEKMAVPEWRGIVVEGRVGVSAENGVGLMIGPKAEAFSQLQMFVLLQELNA